MKEEPEPAVKDILVEATSEKECEKICEQKFCHGMIFENGICRCLLCTGPMFD